MAKYKIDKKIEEIDKPDLSRKAVYKRFIEIVKEIPPQAFAIIRKYNLDVLKELNIGFFNNNVLGKLEYEFPAEVLKKWSIHYFKKRVIIPYDEDYFSGRTLNKHAKKKNIFPPKIRKRLWYIKSKNEKPEGLLLVEGETDAIAAKHIFKDIYDILSLGGVHSKVRGEIVNYLRSDKIIIGFDKDDTGLKHTNKLAKELIEDGYTVFELSWEHKFKDIDELWVEYKNNATQNIEVKKYQPLDIWIDKGFKSITKKEYKKIIEDNFPSLWQAVNLCLSIITINKLKKWTDPVNVNLVGPPSSQKTTALSFFYNIDELIYKSDNFTPKSFVSHATTIKKEELEEVDLLPKIKDKCFVAPELAPLFGKRKEDLTELIGILTRVFDGEGLETDSGSHGHRGYTGEYLFTMLGATTPLPKTAWNIMAKMGSRMFFFSVYDEVMGDDELCNIVYNSKSYGDKLKVCKEATKRMIYTLFQDGKKRNLEWDDTKNDKGAALIIIKCAKMLTRLRAAIQIWEDDYTNTVVYESPQIEHPMRIINIFKNIAKGHAITEGRNSITMDDVWMLPIITASTMPEDRMEAFSVFIQAKEEQWDIEMLSKRMNSSEKVVRKIMKTFEVLKIVKSFKFSSSHQLIYQFDEEFKSWMDDITLAFPFLTTIFIASLSMTVRNRLEKIKIKERENRGLYTGEKGENEGMKEKTDAILQDIVPTKYRTQDT